MLGWSFFYEETTKSLQLSHLLFRQKNIRNKISNNI